MIALIIRHISFHSSQALPAFSSFDELLYASLYNLFYARSSFSFDILYCNNKSNDIDCIAKFPPSTPQLSQGVEGVRNEGSEGVKLSVFIGTLPVAR